MSSKLKTQVLEYKQNSQNYLSVILPHEIIDSNSEVLVYGKNAGGYQREPEPSHYNKIKDYILNKNDFILPTSIVLAVDENEISKFINKENSSSFLELENRSANKKLFRIVDGQHRIIAMREAIKLKPELSKFLFDVVILITKHNKRSIEMEVFYDINSKGKRLKVDLIELARFNYRILEKTFKEREINEHVSIQTAYYLNENIKDSVWNNAIKFGIHDDHILGVIGVNAFRESITTVVDVFLKEDEKGKFKTLLGEDLVKYTRESAEKIADFIHKAWNNTIKKKWEFCFKDGVVELDLFYEPKKVFYNHKYYIQRTMGAKAINSILGSIVNKKIDGKFIGLSETALSTFDQLIKNTNITSDDWVVGGTFSGYSSESGFKKVTQFIENKATVTR
jgi:DGQHR domain-containing protein